MKLSIVLRDFHRRASAGWTDATKLAFAQSLQRVLDYFGDVSVERITEREVHEFESWLNANYSHATARETITDARRAFAEYRAVNELTEAEVRRLIELISDSELKALAMLVACYGLRIEDALRLSRNNLAERRLAYRCGKTRKKMSVPLAANHAALLFDLLEVHSGRLFPNLRANRSTLHAAFVNAVAKAGLADKVRGLVTLRRFFLKRIRLPESKDTQ